MPNERTAAESPDGEEVVRTPEPTPSATSTTTPHPPTRDSLGQLLVACWVAGCGYVVPVGSRGNLLKHCRRVHAKSDVWNRPPGWSSPTGRTRRVRRRDEVLADIRAFASTPPNPGPTPTAEREPTLDEVRAWVANIHPDFSEYENGPPRPKAKDAKEADP